MNNIQQGSKAQYNGAVSPSGINLPNTKSQDTLYNKHDLFEKLAYSPVSIISSIVDVMMNYLRGKNHAKVVWHFYELSNGYWRLLAHDIDNEGTTPEIVCGQLLYVVKDENRNHEEGGKTGIFGVGWKQLITKITDEQVVVDNGGINVLTHRVNSNDNKYYQVSNSNPWLYGTPQENQNVKFENFDSIDQSSFEFLDDFKPNENFLALDIPINKDVFNFKDGDSIDIDVIGDLLATYFVKALDDGDISFHLRKTDIHGNVEEVDVNEGAYFINEYSEFIKYRDIPKQKESFFVNSKNSYTAKYLRSSELTNALKEEAKKKQYRVFGHIPELNMRHLDDWKGFAIDANNKVGVILGTFGNKGKSEGIPYAIMFIEVSVKHIGTDSAKGQIMFPSTTPWKKLNGKRGKDYILTETAHKYTPITIVGNINSALIKYAKKVNPKEQFKETSRRDLGMKILRGEWPVLSLRDSEPHIDASLLKEFLGEYKLEINTDVTNIAISDENSLFLGKTDLDLSVVNHDTKYTICNEWKTRESKFVWQQIITELSGWKKKFGKYPNMFILSADSEAKKHPMDSHNNFSDDTKDLLNDLKLNYPEIVFKLVDTRYYKLNKEYKYFESYK